MAFTAKQPDGGSSYSPNSQDVNKPPDEPKSEQFKYHPLETSVVFILFYSQLCVLVSFISLG